MKIDRLILRLPPDMRGRERSLGTAVAQALAAEQARRSLAGGSSLKSASVTLPHSAAAGSNGTIAAGIAQNTFRRFDGGK